jgi:hypothetical protein
MLAEPACRDRRTTMRYEKPEFVEIKMDAEIGSYQSDFDNYENDPVIKQGIEQGDEQAHAQ